MNSTHIAVAHVDKRLSILTVKQETSNGIVPVNIKKYCLGNSSVTHEIAKHSQLLRI